MNQRAAQDILLSIVIPTRSRCGYLKNLLAAIIESVAVSGYEHLIEVCCVDNFSTDETRETVEAFSVDHAYIKYFKQPEPFGTAEESMSSAVRFAKGEYIWTLGDDDLIIGKSFQVLIPLLQTRQYKYLLINCSILNPKTGLEYLYFDPAGESLSYKKAADLYKDFGFVTHTTTISCLCFDRKLFLSISWKEMHSISEMYSHSFGIFAVFKDEPAYFLRSPLVQFRMQHPKEEVEKYVKYSRQLGRTSLRWFHCGLIDLMTHMKERYAVPIEWFVDVQEIEFNRNMMVVAPIRFSTFILRAMFSQAKLIMHRRDPREFFTNQELTDALAFLALTDCRDEAQRLTAAIRRLTDQVRRKKPIFSPYWLLKLNRLQRQVLKKDPSLFFARNFELFFHADNVQKKPINTVFSLPALLKGLFRIYRHLGLVEFFYMTFYVFYIGGIPLVIYKVKSIIRGIRPIVVQR